MLLSRKRRDLAILALFFLLPLILFWPVTVGGKTLLPLDNLFAYAPWSAYADEFGVSVPHNALVSDLILENYVWKQFIIQSIQAGEIPLWNPNLFAGVPFLAAGQHSALYPFSLIYYVLPLHKAYGWFTVSQLWLAGACMYWLGRTLKMGRGGALLAGVVYQLSAFFVIGAVFPMMIAGAAWLPFLLAALERLITRAEVWRGQRVRWLWLVLGAAGLGMVSLAGHVEVLYYTLLVMAFYAVWRLVTLLRAGAHSLRESAVTGAWLLALVALGLALGAVQIVPLYELAQFNFRQGAATYAEVQGWAYPPRHALAFIMPNFYGNPAYHRYFDLFQWQWVGVTLNALGEPISTIDWGIKNYVEGAAYVGILPLLLAAIGLIRQPAEKATRWFFAALAGLSLTFAFGLPTYAVLYYGLPFVNQLHSPFRWVWPMGMAVAVLAGFGGDALNRGEANGRVERVLTWVALAGGVAALVGGGVGFVAFGQLEPIFDRVLRSLALADRAFADARMFFSFEALQVGLFGLTLVLVGVVLWLWRSGRSATLHLRGRALTVPLGATLATVLVAADLMLASGGFHGAADPATLELNPPAIEFLQADDGLWRLTTYNEPGVKTLNANAGWLFGLADVRGYDSIIPKQYTDYMALIAPQNELPYNRVAPLFTDTPEALESPLLDLLGVKYVVTETTIDAPGYEQVYSGDDGLTIYENTRVMPRAFTLPLSSTVAVDDFGESAQTYDVRQHVLLEDFASAPAPIDPQPAQAAEAAITVYTANEVWVDVDVSEESWLVLADSYFVGWRAWTRPIGGADDEETEVTLYRVNGNFRGVLLDAGRHTIRMKYSPDSFKFGAFGSFMAGAVLVFGLAVWVWRRTIGTAAEGSETGSATQRVARNSLAPIVLNLFNRGIDFAFAFIMLRILRPESAGYYYTAIVVWGWFEILTNFGLNTFLTREVARNPQDARRYLFNTSALRLAFVLVGIPALVGFMALRQGFIDPPLTPETVLTIALLYAGLVPGSLSTGLTALFYAFEKAEYPAAITTITTILKALVGVGVLVAGFGIVGLAGASILTNVVTLAMLGTLAWRNLEPVRNRVAVGIERDLQRHMLGESFPLMINHLLATLFFKIDVLLLEAIKGAAAVGRYSTAYKWLDALNIVPSFFTLAMFPVMSRQAAEDRPALLRAYTLAVKLMFALALPIAVATALVARALIGFLGGPEYLPDGAIALQLIIWSIPIGWINSVTQYVLIALDRQKTLTWAFVVGATFNIVANLIYMPLYGFRAAAIITIFSELTLLIAFYWVLRGELKPAVPQGQRAVVPWPRILWRPLLAGAMMAGSAAVVYGLAGMLAALAAGFVVYAGATLMLQPFDVAERERIEQLLPARLRDFRLRR